jgi:hypothetical protein
MLCSTLEALSIVLIQQAEELHERIIQKNVQQGTALLHFQATPQKNCTFAIPSHKRDDLAGTTFF